MLKARNMKKRKNEKPSLTEDTNHQIKPKTKMEAFQATAYTPMLKIQNKSHSGN